MKKVWIIAGVILALGAGAAVFFLLRKDLSGKIILPYIAHQKPRIDPHVPGTVALADKLDEVLFEGLFNIAANPSGIVYEDGLGEFLELDGRGVVSIRIRPGKKWHSSFGITMKKDLITVSEKEAVRFTAKDLKFTLKRIQSLGSISPDYILVSQAVSDFDFSGPDENHVIRFQFRGDRIWTEADIKEILSFKILPFNSEMKAADYHDGTGPYMYAGTFENTIYFQKYPEGKANIANILLKPFIDNSTYTTEIRNKNINTMLSTPFGSVSPILNDTSDFFYKSSVATTFFSLLFNCERLNPEQRRALRALIDNKKLVKRFFKMGSEQQRNIANYQGKGNNYADYLNYSMFPTTTYYVQEQVVSPMRSFDEPNLSVLPDTIRIQTSLNFGYREELSEIVEIMNDPSVYGGRVKVEPVSNETVKQGNYDAVLVAIDGYRSNFLFDLYDIFLREPDFAVKKIHLKTKTGHQGREIADSRSFTASKNFCRLDLSGSSEESANIQKLLEQIYGFMSTSEIGDKQAYAQLIDELDQEMALGRWLFSLPSLAYFRTQFNAKTIDLYGIASQLSTIEKWQER